MWHVQSHLIWHKSPPVAFNVAIDIWEQTHRQVAPFKLLYFARVGDQDRRHVPGIDVPQYLAARVKLAVKHRCVSVVSKAASQISIEAADESGRRRLGAGFIDGEQAPMGPPPADATS